MRRNDLKDSKKRYFRAGDRIVNQDGAWYISAREGDVGPFPTRSAVERAVQLFPLGREHLSKFQRSRQQPSAQAFKQAPKPAPKAVAKRVQAESCAQQRRHHLGQMVESDALMLTLDVDFQL
jgi:hypothetical protein